MDQVSSPPQRSTPITLRRKGVRDEGRRLGMGNVTRSVPSVDPSSLVSPPEQRTGTREV